MANSEFIFEEEAIYDEHKQIKELTNTLNSMIGAAWKSEEISLVQDTININRMNIEEPDKANLIKFVIGFSLVGDQIVEKNLGDNLITIVKYHTIKKFYVFQQYMEIVHIETYAKIGRAIMNNDELAIYTNINTYPESIAKKITWIKKWCSDNVPFNLRIIGMAISELVLFSGLFLIIFWFKTQGDNVPFPGIIQANEFILRDENLHGKFGLQVLSYINDRPDDEIIYQIMREAVDIECTFIKEAFKNGQLNFGTFNFHTAQMYIKYLADRVLTDIPSKNNNKLKNNRDNGEYLKPIYNVVNPCLFMELMSAPIRENPMEVKTTIYQNAKMAGADNFNSDEEF